MKDRNTQQVRWWGRMSADLMVTGNRSRTDTGARREVVDIYVEQ